DSFLAGQHSLGSYDFVLTNPPWETLKPDRRELEQLGPAGRESFEQALRSYDRTLAKLLPNSQPDSKFSGWGTNLSRCGLELSLSLTKPNGLCGIVLPASLFSDLVSARLRRWAFHEATPKALFYYPAEARLFERVDQPCVSAVFARIQDQAFHPTLYRFSSSNKLVGKDSLE